MIESAGRALRTVTVSTRLKPLMRHLRANLTLLLCLTVPVGGWWSVMHDALCTPVPGAESSMSGDAEAAGHGVTIAGHVAGHSHHHHTGEDSHDKTDGGHACPSPIGAMASAESWVYVPAPATAAIVSFVAPHPVAAHNNFPLRPPISEG